jgi:excinuclease ABC subunit C
MNLSSLKSKIIKLPKSPGVYVYYGKKREVLYVGKATNLRSRVGSYFSTPNTDKRFDLGNATSLLEVEPRNATVRNLDRPIGYAIDQIADIEIKETDSVLEALILESALIKKYEPKYNAMGKDDKSFAYFVITKEEWPRVIILRKTDIEADKKLGVSRPKRPKDTKFRYAKIYGPYTSKKQMQIALKIVRRIFPFHSINARSEKGDLDFQLGLCPGPYAGAISKADYMKNIRGIKMILEGKKKTLVKKLEKEMHDYAKKNEFEKAAEARNKVFALRHIRDVALMTGDALLPEPPLNLPLRKGEKNLGKDFRVEAYDISNISGQHATGSMVVFKNGEPDKSQYRKFKIKNVEGSDDVGMMKEVLLRRFKNDWPQPDLILLDGGKGHLNMAQKLDSDLGLIINIAAVAKGPSRKKLTVHSQQFTDSSIKNILDNKNILKRIMDEAHRFAISYHKKLRGKSLLN